MSYISSILRQALQTFAVKTSPEIFINNLSKLKQLLDKLTKEHINFDSNYYLNSEIWENKAPMTYIDIYEDDNVNIGVFVIKPGMKLPLHSHPQMHGCLKVIAGTVKIESFSLNTEATKRYEKSNDINDAPLFQTVIAEKMDGAILDASSECCLLEPHDRNLHEIESIGGAAAFLDVLSPPYDADVPVYGRRKCSYYKVFEDFGDSVYRLIEIPSPTWFWSDRGTYQGPSVYDKNVLDFLKTHGELQ